MLQVNLELSPPALVVIGALSAATGRLILALGARHFRSRMSEERLENIDALGAELTANRKRGLAGLALFLVSPLPSAQLFIAAGILDAPLRPLLAAFLVGRLFSYSLYVGIATVAADGLGDLIADSLSSPPAIALQVAMLLALAALVKVDWARLLHRGSRES